MARLAPGASTFTTVYQEVNSTRAPLLETDASGNLFVMLPNFGTGTIDFYRFDAPNYGTPRPARINGTLADGKYTAYYDGTRDRIVYAAMSYSEVQCPYRSTRTRLYTLDTNGNLESERVITEFAGGRERSYIEYPHVTVDAGQIYMAWTTDGDVRTLSGGCLGGGAPAIWGNLDGAKNTAAGSGRFYSAIQFMKSADSAATFTRTDGASINLPLIPDQLGGTQSAIPSNLVDGHRWLSNFVAHNGVLHFAHQNGDSNDLSYRGFNLLTNQFDRGADPGAWKGSSLAMGHSGYFVKPHPLETQSHLYFVSLDRITAGSESSRVSILRSLDNGRTWDDYAAVESLPTEVRYLSGARQVTPDGQIVGMYVEGKLSDPDKKVKFFRVAAGRPKL